MELRCPSKLHAVLLTPATGIEEFSCDSRFCGKVSGVTVRHQFDLATGQLLETHKYKTLLKGAPNGTRR